jgi:hypothetical protein
MNQALYAYMNNKRKMKKSKKIKKKGVEDDSISFSPFYHDSVIQYRIFVFFSRISETKLI